MLLGGASGTGKSTLASLLASKLGISTVLSSDSIRHILRNFMTKEEKPVLFASTYETGKYVSEEEHPSEKKRTIVGYKEQSNLVQEYLEDVLEDYYNRKESIVIEGVHLTIRFMKKMMRKFTNVVIPFAICIKNEDKHKERFAVWSKSMTIDPKLNKYIEHFKSIRTIQKYLVKKAEKVLIPRIDNTNVDKSLGLIHSTMIRCLRRI